MKTLIFNLLLAASVSLIMFSCADEERFDIDPLVKSHVDQFFVEAESRGLLLTKENLTVGLNENEHFEDRYNGMSKKRIDHRYVTLSLRFVEEFGAESVEVRNLVFHELGHALLKKVHVDYFSIMSEGYYDNMYDSAYQKELYDDLFTLHK